MSDIRSYMKYKQQREKQEQKESKRKVEKDYRTKIREHRMRYFFACLSVVLIAAVAGTVFYIQLKNRIYSDYEVQSSVR